ncbi:MAG TPA: hypothetical protein VFZ04_10840 [Longimicrobiales bacterium]
MKLSRIIPAILLLGACASSQQTATTGTAQQATAQAAVNPVGAYEFTTTVDGQTVTGTLHIEGTPGAYKGRILTSVFPEIPVVGATVENNNVINVKANMPDGELTLRMVMEGMNFKGNWTLGADGGEFNGKKLPN